MDQNVKNKVYGDDEKVDNPIIDLFKKMMEEEKNFEYEKYFKSNNTTEDFYDDEADSEDEKQVAEELKSHFVDKPIESDAVLNCPGCMSTLTIDCQQHEIYKNQFRAMFVENCKIDSEETLICPIINKKNRPVATNSELEDAFHPVNCEICQTRVGVVNNNGLYHFFNVIPSD